MADTIPLSELCSICYTDKPKYRCPRCKTQTCSLPCYKRHQQRAACNGKRDPAEYLKKSQLATPAGIDRDYNYLKDVERTIDRSSRETSDRGIGSGRAVSKFVYKATHPEGKLQKYLDANRITVTRAPKGMSRQKSNNTRSTKRDNIMWTVEWIYSSGESETRDDCLAESSLHDLYQLIQIEKKNLLRKPAEDEIAQAVAGKKRKRKNPLTESDPKDDSRARVSTDAVSGTTNGSIPSERGAQDAGSLPPDPVGAGEDEEPQDAAPEINTPANSGSPQSRSQQDPKTATHPTRFFYLRKPGTTSTSKVLIPLAPDRTLTQSLQDQVVLEYPTIYVLPHTPDALPTEFTTETQYTAMLPADEPELPAASHTAGSKAAISAPRHAEPKAPVMDANQILDMLKRDVTR